MHSLAYFNPRSPHGERLRRAVQNKSPRQISIHAPRTGSDPNTHPNNRFSTPFQSTLPARGATQPFFFVGVTSRFQSTLPARGATWLSPFESRSASNFNPRSPHGERPTYISVEREGRRISIHAPRTGSDRLIIGSPTDERRFQSTLPARGATSTRPRCTAHRAISIHAPRTGSDLSPGTGGHHEAISIHAPRTGSDLTARNQRTATGAISIHAPRTGSDTAQHPDSPRGGHFNPRSPHGERQKDL